MASALGLNSTVMYASVFAVGDDRAGLAGALAAPVRSITSGMGFSVLIDSFIVTIIGGMGSVSGALAAALLLGLVRSFRSLAFPLFVEGLDRKGVGKGKGVSVRVDLGGRRVNKKKK